MLTIEVAYALPDRQWLERLSVPEGSSLLDALRCSSLWQQWPELAPAEALLVGVWGRGERQPAERRLRNGDRIEIYRPRTNDPKEARKVRAARVRAARGDR
ncbi:MAG: RnfH family protein [Perlucidibaca sp.]